MTSTTHPQTLLVNSEEMVCTSVSVGGCLELPSISTSALEGQVQHFTLLGRASFQVEKRMSLEPLQVTHASSS
jgi:hypothetical protein